MKQTLMLIIKDADNNVLLYQRPPTGLWGGLWSLPQTQDLRDAEQETGLKLDLDSAEAEAPLRHTFSHFHLDITPMQVKLRNTPTNRVMEGAATLWYNISQPQRLAWQPRLRSCCRHVSNSGEHHDPHRNVP